MTQTRNRHDRTDNNIDDESTYESSDVSNHSGDPSENKNDYPAQNERVGGAKAMVEDDSSIFNHAGSRQRQRGSLS